jgi:hypothetical protein
MHLASIAWQALASAQAPVRLLNNPRTLLRRQALLRTLHGAGANPFAVHTGDQAAGRVRFPAFVRRPDEHDGSLSPLLHTQQELDAALRQLQLQHGLPPQRLLVVEFCNTADSDGVYRKYAAFIVGDQIIPRHLMSSRNWIVKHADIATPDQQAEESAYLSGNPHAQQLRDIFAIANVDFGRIDYGMHAGKLVIWEINTNPMLGLDPCKIAPHRLAMQAAFFKRLNEAMAGLGGESPQQPIPWSIPAALRQQLGLTRRRRAMRRVGRMLQRLGRLPPWRQALQAAT